MKTPRPDNPIVSVSSRTPLLRAVEVSKSFSQRKVLNQLDLQVFPVQRIAIVGENGAGKTTLLRCLAGETQPSAGTVQWLDSNGQPLPRAKRCIGVVAHQCRLYPELTARENLLFAARMCHIPNPKPRVAEWLAMTRLDQHADRLTLRFSRGMQQRLAIARALIHNPPLALLDEPFAGMDQQGTDWLCRFLTEYTQQDRAIIFVTHEFPFVKRLATRILELHRGRLIEHPLNADFDPSSSATSHIAA